VGSGKTLVSFLAPLALGAVRPLLLVPAELRDKTHTEWAYWKAVLPLPPLRVMTYHDLSSRTKSALLDTYGPDLIVADEAHRLKDPQTARVRRLASYFRKHPQTDFVALSGTLLRSSIMELGHLCDWALRERSPVPRNWNAIRDWSCALDVKPQLRLAPGVLEQWSVGEGTRLDRARSGFAKRFAETPGVVVYESAGRPEASLRLVTREPEVPSDIQRALASVAEGIHPYDGSFLEPVQAWALARQLSSGFYYKYVTPPPKWWLDARTSFTSWITGQLKRRFRGVDSPAQVCERWPDAPELLAWRAAWAQWRPTREAVWISDFLVSAVRNLTSEKATLVFVHHRAFGDALEKRGLPYYRSGTAEVYGAAGRSVGLAAKAFTEGYNLQAWSNSLVVSPPSAGAEWEQLIARTHRTGQTADEVEVTTFLQGTGLKALRSACAEAIFLSTQNGPQRLLLADYVDGG
jgi:hypothetical protein